MNNPTWRWSLAAGAVFVGLLRLHATETTGLTHRLELANGEVLVGALVAEEDNAIVFRSQTWGEVRVSKAGARLSVVPPASAEPASMAPGWVKAQPEGSVPAPAATQAPAVKWRRTIEAGYSYQSTGSLVSTQTTYARAEIVRESPTGQMTLDGRYLYGEQDDVKNTDKLESAFRVREKLKDRWNVRNTFSYSYDNLKDIENQFEEILGLSYEVFNTPRFYYAIGPGAAVQYAEPALGESGLKYLCDISHELRWQIVPRISLTNGASVLFRPDAVEDHRFRTNATLSGQLTDHVSVNLRYEYEYEAIRPVASGRSDNRVFTTLGYVF